LRSVSGVAGDRRDGVIAPAPSPPRRDRCGSESGTAVRAASQCSKHPSERGIAVREELLRLKGIELVRHETRILRGINLVVRRGTMLGLIGPNGAGKSSLIKVAAGIIRPSRGEVIYDGRPLLALDERERGRNIGLMSQNPGVGFGFQVADVVAMGRYPHRRRFEPLGKDDHEVIRRAMEVAGVWHLKERSLTTLSGGERQRVFLARALAQSPRLLILDEPTANLDIRYQLEILHLVRRLNEADGLTVVVAIHDLTLALRFCDEVAALSQGELVAAGRTQDVLTEELIRRVFGVRACVGDDPATGRARVDYIEVV